MKHKPHWKTFFPPLGYPACNNNVVTQAQLNCYVGEYWKDVNLHVFEEQSC